VIQEIHTFEKSYLPSDNVLMIAVELGMANQYVRDLSVNIQRGIREKVRRGVYSGKAPLGYVNGPLTRTIEPHPEHFQNVKQHLEEFAKGRQTLTALQRALAAAGLVGVRSGKPLPLSSIGNLLHNPFYYGVFLHKGELHQGIHVPMITKDTFDAIQAALVTVGKPRHHREEGKGFLFLNFATCGSCGYSITAERHIKKSGLHFTYYRCTRKNRQMACAEQGYLRQEALAEEVKRNTALVTLPDEWKEKFLVKLESWEAEAEAGRQRQVDRLKAELADLKIRLDRLNAAFVDGGLELAEFKELKNPLIEKKTGLEQQVAAATGKATGWLEPVRNWILEANRPKIWASEGNLSEMKSFLLKVGSNRKIRSQTLTVEFNKPWISLAETTVAVHCTNSVATRNSNWWRRRESNPRPEQSNQQPLHA
jgi:site-specific DNA recombinase